MGACTLCTRATCRLAASTASKSRRPCGTAGWAAEATVRKAAESSALAMRRNTAMMGATSGRANTSAAEASQGNMCAFTAERIERPTAWVRYRTATSERETPALSKAFSLETTQSASHAAFLYV